MEKGLWAIHLGRTRWSFLFPIVVKDHNIDTQSLWPYHCHDHLFVLFQHWCRCFPPPWGGLGTPRLSSTRSFRAQQLPQYLTAVGKIFKELLPVPSRVWCDQYVGFIVGRGKPKWLWVWMGWKPAMSSPHFEAPLWGWRMLHSDFRNMYDLIYNGHCSWFHFFTAYN